MTPNENQEKHSAELDTMVDAFLCWPLPPSVCCDLCATEANYPNRVGTNLLTWTEARQMLEHVTVPLRTELSTLRKELEGIKARTAIQAIERLIKTCCSECGHDTTEDGCANCFEIELESAKKAKDWIEYWGPLILTKWHAAGMGKRFEPELSELLNNGKDGK